MWNRRLHKAGDFISPHHAEDHHHHGDHCDGDDDEDGDDDDDDHINEGIIDDYAGASSQKSQTSFDKYIFKYLIFKCANGITKTK